MSSEALVTGSPANISQMEATRDPERRDDACPGDCASAAQYDCGKQNDNRAEYAEPEWQPSASEREPCHASRREHDAPPRDPRAVVVEDEHAVETCIVEGVLVGAAGQVFGECSLVSVAEKQGAGGCDQAERDDLPREVAVRAVSYSLPTCGGDQELCNSQPSRNHTNVEACPVKLADHVGGLRSRMVKGFRG